jgi:ligand-binding sensor domain-containing protein/anti-sigma regulatory factor (Ser/Thr protein kinase)
MTRSLLSAFHCFICVCSFAQQVFFKSFTVQDGLVANPVRCIYQDNRGFIWIGTFEGLSRYDGYKFTNYTTNNGLSHNFINSFYQLGDQLLIAENSGAVDIVQNNSIRKGLQLTSAANAIISDKRRILMTTDTSGIFEYRDGKIIQRNKLGSVALGHVVIYNDSLLLADGVDNNLVFYDTDLKVVRWIKNLGIHFYFLFRDSKQRVWACTSQGLKLLPGDVKKDQSFSFQPLPSLFNFAPVSQAEVYSMVEEKEGGFWIGTGKGLIHLFADGSYQVYNEKDGLPSSSINTLFFDKENNLWIGTSLGLARWVSKNNVIFFNTEKKQFKNDLYSIQMLPDKKIILTSQHGLQQLDFATKEFKDIGPPGHGSCIPVTGTWPLLVIRQNTICVLDESNNTLKKIQKLDKEISVVSSACAQSPENIFLGSFNGLFAVHSSSIKQLLPYRVTSLITDKNGVVWVGTWTNGLYRIEVKKKDSIFYDVKEITFLSGQKEIRSLYEDSKKNMWVGTRYGGLFRLAPKLNGYEVKRFNRKTGLMSDWIRTVTELENGDMWIGTFLGLDRLVKEPDGYRVFNFSKATNFFAQIDGIASVGNNNWICLANTGLAIFHDEELHKTSPLPVTFLSAGFGVLGNRLTLFSFSDNIVLSHKQNTARFEFSALGFSNEKQVLYSFRLKGSSDTAWSRPENIHEAFYASLAPGKYTFQVRTIGWNGQLGTPESLFLRIKAPFWNQWWFYILCIVVIALFFYSLYRYRISHLLRVQKVRNSIATDLHDEIGSTLTNISVLSELSDKTLDQPEKLRHYLQRITEEANASGQALDDIIWSVNTTNDTLSEMMTRMRRFASELFDHTDTQYHFTLEEGSADKKLDMEQRRDIYLVYKEALNNIYKHASAKNVFIRLAWINHLLEMEIKDDGQGFDPKHSTHRNGLKNMKSRIDKWKGTVTIESAQYKGTMILVKLPAKTGTAQMNSKT